MDVASNGHYRAQPFPFWTRLSVKR